LKILVVQESDWLERNVHQQHHLMERLCLRGHEVRAIDFEITWNRKNKKGFYSKRRVFNDISKVCKGSSVTVVRPSILKLPLLDYVSIAFSHSNEIRDQIVEFKPDVIIGLGILNAFIAMIMAKRHKIPFVYYLIDALHTLIPIRKLRYLGRMLEGETLKRCDVVCVINNELKRYATGLGASPEKIRVVKAGVDTDRFKPGMSRYPMRKKLGIGKDDIVLFFMGWLYAFSGLKEVAVDLIKVRDEHPDLRLVIVGEGDLFHELEQIKKEYGLEQLILAGRQAYETIPRFIAASDVCLLPAYNNEVMRNIVPIKMYEYMACGRPVIATRLPGIMNEFGFHNGVIYVNRPTEVLATAVKISNHRANLSRYGAKARKLVEKYSWDKVTNEFEDVLRAALGEPELSQCQMQG
jgi:glycosyltransferase involved in cell wall biosynthesis